MIESLNELRARAAADPDMASLLLKADWYLIGSRATGWADDLSDWDTVMFCRDDDNKMDSLADNIDVVFDIERPSLTGKPDLTFHVASRRVRAVDIEMMGPSSRASALPCGLLGVRYSERELAST